MIFARRQANALRDHGVDVEVFYLRSRTSPWRLAREYVRFRGQLKATRPQVVHAHYGTVTALFSALAGRGHPLVITFRGGDLNPANGPSFGRVRGWLGRMLSQLASCASARACGNGSSGGANAPSFSRAEWMRTCFIRSLARRRGTGWDGGEMLR
jgi:hypothetical protein